MELATVGGGGEAALALLVLGALLVAAALLSYFVVAPEYEKRLDRRPLHDFQRFHRLQDPSEQLPTRQQPLRMHSLGAWGVSAGSSASDEDGERFASPVRIPRRHVQLHRSIGPGTFAAAAIRHARSAVAMTSASGAGFGSLERDWSPSRLTHRRKSESDALQEANVARADVLRRRVLLRRLEEEIEGAKNANEAQMKAPVAGGPLGSLRGRRLSSSALAFSEERLELLLAHPADCERELAVLAAAHNQRQQESEERQADVGQEVKDALRLVHDVLALHLSVDHRDMNKVTVFCNSLLKYDGLNNLRALELAGDQDVRTLANSIIEKAVPAIWH